MGLRGLIEGLGIEVGDVKDGEQKIVKQPLIKIKGNTEEELVRLGIVPEAYKSIEFDVEELKNKIIESVKEGGKKYKFKNFQEYVSIITGILTSLRLGQRLKCSYLISAPVGSGKKEFVFTGLKILHSRGYKIVPYISLLELAKIRLDFEKRLLNYSWERDVNYSWLDYTNTELLFCYLSDANNTGVEINTLKTILDIRANKGIPTVVLTSYSTHLTNKENWLISLSDSIITKTEVERQYDRLYMINCYKVQNNLIGDESSL